MKATLKVKNFGPIVDAELDLRNVNVFIGPQASGKSTLAKLYAICKSPLNYFDDFHYDLELSGEAYIKAKSNRESVVSKRFINEFEKLNIRSFVNKNTFFEYDSEVHKVTYNNGEIKLERKLLTQIHDFGELISKGNLVNANSYIKRHNKNNILVSVYGVQIKYFSLIGEGVDFNFDDFVNFNKDFNFEKENFDLKELTFIYNKLKETERKILLGNVYVPAERIIVPILKGAALNLQNNDVPIPKHILSFAAEYERSLNNLKEFDLSFLKKGYAFKSVNGEDRFFFNEKESVLLSESATGIQSLIPLLLPIFSFKEELPYSQAYIIEEPEMNLYPKAQYDLIKHLESNRMEGKLDTTFYHLYTTHSPYILASFNNMLYAYKKSILSEEDNEKLKEIESVMPKENWLDPENFNAYTIIDGKAVQIFDREIGLIDENVIDEVSEEMNDDFNSLLEI